MSYLDDPTNLAAQANASADRDLVAKNLRRIEVDDFKWIVAHAQGRRFLWRLLSMTGVFRTSMTGDSWTFHNEGQRNIGLQLMAEFNEHSLDAYVRMLKEVNNG
jgi:hypothetical protein